ncbi:hypothetical protein BGZ70_000198 [Mortierella alpina]|uniref:UBR-type domain-containing protein n=1 Tax=Mortierella alpina TaxID=64518 RepID=A0A9P6LYU2_MORAP|nr:hypothetical protein BGZ70_000198 [Mortierella alpina]
MAEQDTITVSEYIAEQERLEKEAKELFPKKFDICSNSMGYIRQPVYSCLTCNPNPSEEAGFCYSCSISCHGDHNLVELFTKRSFRCDCGTVKFKHTPCKLDVKPAGATNELNQYNHNYLGRFCWCDIQYDPAKEESTMLQCVVCEDWFHDTCIGIHSLFMIGLSKKGGDPKSITMVDCSKEKKDVKGKSVAHKDVKEDKSETAAEEVDVVALDTTPSEKEAATTSLTTATTSTTTETTTTTVVTAQAVTREQESQSSTVSQVKRSLETTDGDVGAQDGSGESNKKIKLSAEDATFCKLDRCPADAYPDQEMNLFATEGWRDLLCQCTKCTALYTEESVSFILGEEAIYEDEEDEEADTSILESGMKKLSEMDRAKMEQRAALGGKPNFF